MPNEMLANAWNEKQMNQMLTLPSFNVSLGAVTMLPS